MSNTTQTAGQLATTTPPTMAIIGPGFQYYIVPNGTGGQFAGLNLPPVSLSSNNTGQTVDIGFVDSANNTVQLSAINPTVYSLTDGRVYLQGTSAALAQSITVKAQIVGRQADRTGYIVVDVTNNGGSSLSLKSVVLSLNAVHFCQSRYYNITASTGDAYAYDGTNKQLNLTNSGVTGVTISFASNFGAFSGTQHYKVVDASYNPLAEVVSNGSLADSATATATATKWVYLAIGDTSNQISIASSATTRFVFIVAAGATQSAANTLISNAKSNYAADITTFNGYASATRMTSSTSTSLDALLDYLLMKTLYNSKHAMANGGYTFSPAGAYVFFSSFCRDSYMAAQALAQASNTTTISDIFALLHSVEASNHSQYHEIVTLLAAGGFNPSNSRNGTPGDQDMFAILIGYEYYIRTLDATWLTNNIGSINNIAAFLRSYYDNNNVSGKSSDNAFSGAGNSTYLDSNGDITGQTNCVDPVFMAILIHALRAVTELNTAAGNTNTAAVYRNWRDSLIAIMPVLWNATNGWPVFNKKVDGSTTYNNVHLMKIDALIFDALQDTAKQASMLSSLAGAGSIFWDSTDTGFYMMPTTDGNYSFGSYWNGQPWHIGDYKAFSTIFRYGTSAQAQWAWTQLQAHVTRVLNNNIFCPGEHYTNVGLFDFSAGSFVEMLVHGLWGIDAHASYFTINPNIYKLALGGTWTLSNYQMGNSTWTITYTNSNQNNSILLDGGAVSGNISYPSAGSHTLAITNKAAAFSMIAL